MLKLMVMKRVIDIGLIGTMEEVVFPMDKVGAFDELESSSVLWFNHRLYGLDTL